MYTRTNIAAFFRFSGIHWIQQDTLDTEEDDEQELGISEVSSNFDDKSDEPEVDNKGQALDEEVTSEAATSREDNTLNDNIYFMCTCWEFNPGTISGVSTCQKCNKSYSFEDLIWVPRIFCHRYLNSFSDTVCGRTINHGDLKDHMENVHGTKPMDVPPKEINSPEEQKNIEEQLDAVSYTHLTLPTILLV